MTFPLMTAALALPLMLSSCFGRSVEPVGIRPPPPDAELTWACDDPVDPPARVDDVFVDHWIADRAALVACRDRHAELVRHVLRISAPGPQ